MKLYTVPTVTRAVARVRNGESLYAVARDTQVNRTTLWRWCRARGVRSQHDAGISAERRCDSALIARCLASVRAGVSMSVTADLHGTPRSNVQRWCRRFGVSSGQVFPYRARGARAVA